MNETIIRWLGQGIPRDELKFDFILFVYFWGAIISFYFYRVNTNIWIISLKFLLGFPGEIDGAAWLLGQHFILMGLPGLYGDCVLQKRFQPREGGHGNVILLKGKIIIWLLRFMYPGHQGSSWNLPGNHSAVCLVLNRWLGTRLSLTVCHLPFCSA